MLSASKLRVRLETDGSLLVQCGTQDMSSRTYSALGQIATNGLGIPMSKVAVELGDTWSLTQLPRPEDGGSGFLRGSDPQPGPAMWVNH